VGGLCKTRRESRRLQIWHPGACLPHPPPTAPALPRSGCNGDIFCLLHRRQRLGRLLRLGFTACRPAAPPACPLAGAWVAGACVFITEPLKDNSAIIPTHTPTPRHSEYPSLDSLQHRTTRHVPIGSRAERDRTVSQGRGPCATSPSTPRLPTAHGNARRRAEGAEEDGSCVRSAFARVCGRPTPAHPPAIACNGGRAPRCPAAGAVRRARAPSPPRVARAPPALISSPALAARPTNQTVRRWFSSRPGSGCG